MTTWYHCACGCNKKFANGYVWDGYHGPDHNKPVKDREPAAAVEAIGFAVALALSAFVILLAVWAIWHQL